MNHPYRDVDALDTFHASHAAADLVTDALQLGERDSDLVRLIVHGTVLLQENPYATFADVVRAAHDTTEAELRRWWTNWS